MSESPEPDDLDALLARADYWLDQVPDSVSLETSIDVDLVRDLAAAVWSLRDGYETAIDVLGQHLAGGRESAQAAVLAAAETRHNTSGQAEASS